MLHGCQVAAAGLVSAGEEVPVVWEAGRPRTPAGPPWAPCGSAGSLAGLFGGDCCRRGWRGARFAVDQWG